MERLTSKQIQNMEFDILKDFKKYASKNNLKFMLFGGTLLGAIRHKGFIPWDDDIDLCMLREEYDKLLKKARKNPYIDKNKRYKILCPGDKDYVYTFIKIVDTHTIVYEKNIKKRFQLGVWVDIFPLDYCPENAEERNKLLNKIRFYHLMHKFKISGNLNTTSQAILKVIATPLYFLTFNKKKYDYWVDKIIKEIKKTSESNYICDFIWTVNPKAFYKKDWFSKRIKVSFEGEEFYSPKDYDAYLSKVYGNYMELPPEEDRVFHDFEGYLVKKTSD